MFTLIITGIGVACTVPVPSWPAWFHPQINRFPLESTTAVCRSPQATDTISNCTACNQEKQVTHTRRELGKINIYSSYQVRVVYSTGCCIHEGILYGPRRRGVTRKGLTRRGDNSHGELNILYARAHTHTYI